MHKSNKLPNDCVGYAMRLILAFRRRQVNAKFLKLTMPVMNPVQVTFP